MNIPLSYFYEHLNYIIKNHYNLLDSDELALLVSKDRTSACSSIIGKFYFTIEIFYYNS